MSENTIYRIFDSICDDCERGEHVDSRWIKDAFEMAGYSIIKSEELIRPQDKEIAELKLCLKIANRTIREKENIWGYKLEKKKEYIKEIAGLKEQLSEAREVIEFYADKKNYKTIYDKLSFAWYPMYEARGWEAKNYLKNNPTAQTNSTQE